MPPPSLSAVRTGLLFGVAAYAWWGMVPIYFKAVSHVPPLEVLAHRVVWSVLLLGILLTLTRQWAVARRALRSPRIMATLAATTFLIAANWLTFIYAVTSGQLLQSSLGYFINPLVSVSLGFLFLGERLRPLQLASVAVAALGVGYMAVSAAETPTIALILAVSFGLYGLLRKTARVESLVGLSLETMLLFPLALAYLAWLGLLSAPASPLPPSAAPDPTPVTGLAAFFGDALVFGALDRRTDILLALGGVITATPLLWFAAAARRLRLTTIGFLQYISPSFQFLIAVALFGEAFRTVHAVTFGCIWAALALFSIDAARANVQNRARAATASPLSDPAAVPPASAASVTAEAQNPNGPVPPPPAGR